MDPLCNIVVFYWHTRGRLVPVEHRLNTACYLSIAAALVQSLMNTVGHLLMATCSKVMHHVTKFISSQIDFRTMNVLQ